MLDNMLEFVYANKGYFVPEINRPTFKFDTMLTPISFNQSFPAHPQIAIPVLSSQDFAFSAFFDLL
jgi:hypothetical protein